MSKTDLEVLKKYRDFIQETIESKEKICDIIGDDDHTLLCCDVLCYECCFKDKINSRGFKILDQKYTRAEWVKELEILINDESKSMSVFMSGQDLKKDMVNRAKELYNDHDHGSRREKNLYSFKSQCVNMDLDWRLIGWRARMSIKIDQAYEGK